MVRRFRHVIFCAITLAVTAAFPRAVHAGPVIFVDDDAPDCDCDCGSWDTPCSFLQDALHIASLPGSGVTEIRVAQGIYRPDRNRANPDGTGDRLASFGLVSGVAVRGGYAGVGAFDPDVRDIALYETILSGDLLGNDGPHFEHNDENSHHVVRADGTDQTAVVDGCTITGGFTGGPGAFVHGAGALVWPDGGATFSECRFVGNQAVEDGGGLYALTAEVTLTACVFGGNAAGIAGGGARLQNCELSMDGCTFEGNTAGFGGGLYIGTASFVQVVTDCAFIGNIAAVHGGGARLVGSSTLPGSTTFTGCTFSANESGLGGGIYVSSVGAAPLVTCTFTGNAAVRGGGMYSLAGDPSQESCVFTGNNATAEGGGAYILSGAPVYDDCSFSHNEAALSGGGVYNASPGTELVGTTLAANSAPLGGGMYNAIGASTLTGCTISGNSADDGGGFYNFAADPVLTECTFDGNVATGAGGGFHNFAGDPQVSGCDFSANTAVEGGGLYSVGGDPEITACSLSDNTADDGGGAYDAGSDARWSDCVFTANIALNGGAVYNLSTDPLFTSCTLEDNVVTTPNECGFGGGMYNVNSAVAVSAGEFRQNTGECMGGAIFHDGAALTVRRSLFVDNTCGGVGGGISILEGTFTVVSCVFDGNSSTFGGAMSLNTPVSGVLTNCAFLGNRAEHADLNLGWGGAVSNNGAVEIANCTFAGNSSQTYGGAIWNSGSSVVTLTNCILWANPPVPIDESGNAVTTATYSDIQWGFPGAGNIDANPQFVGPVADLRLQPGSPCIDAGLNNGVPPDVTDLDGDGDTVEFTPVDLDGSPRFVNDLQTEDSGCGVPVVVDMGAYEFTLGHPIQPVHGDLDGDLLVGISDFIALLAAWGPCPPGCCLADLDGDGNVSIVDMLKLLAYWS
jgi:hypothetical protein